MVKQVSSYRGASALLGSAFIFSTFGVLARELSTMFSDVAQTAARLALAAIVIAAVVFATGRSVSIDRRDALRAVLLGVVFTLSILCFTIAVGHAKLSTTVALLYGGSILTSMLIGTLVLHEKLGFSKWVVIGVALVGLGLYAQDAPTLGVGLLLAFVSGIFDGLANGLRKTIKTKDRWLVLLYQYGTCAAVGVLMVTFSGELPMHAFSWVALAALIVFALLQVVLGNLLLYGFKHFDVNVGTVTLSAELFFAMLLGLVFFAEAPSWREFTAGVLIFTASTFSTLDIRQVWGGMIRLAKTALGQHAL